MVSIAIFGSGGQVGPSIIKAVSGPIFSSKFSSIKVITSQDRSADSTDKVTYIKSDLDISLADELKSTDVIVSVLPAKEEVLSKLEPIIEAIKPKFYIPSEFGCEIPKIPSDVLSPILTAKVDHNARVEAKGIKVVKISTSFFRIPPVFLYAFTDTIGISQKDAVVKVVGDYDSKYVDFSTADDIGNAVASIASTEPSKVLDTYRIRSGRISLKEVVAKIEAEQGKKYEIKQVELEDEKAELQKNLFNFPQALFVYFSLGEDKGIVFSGDENELINPGQSLWKYNTW
ncbi:hypothetical protein CLIB1444_01S02212 [[Candida] jaroonii]|uniref:Uncharacterized protein n=1 Tax=[Candida] jaroonii TaxID=467808 RepID=A0ACA9Y031_9ASCO|nr:hypothetical protein CLIB1444_01S02212 [[Candida] jaroonii]